MKICAKCVLPATCPGISFDSNGTCNVCHDFDEEWGGFKHSTIQRKKELNKIINSFKNKGKKYDCLVPISGGLDSTYVLYVCSRFYNLRTLAFNFNNGFQSEIARRNLTNATRKLSVDFVSTGPDWEKASKLYALFFRKTGEFCTPCNLGIWSFSYKIAQDFGIPLVVSGSSNRISERLPRGNRIYSWSPYYFKEVIRGEMSIRDAEEYLHLQGDFHNGTLRKISQHFLPTRKINILPIFDYIGWDINLMLKTLKDELNWKQEADRFHHIDCTMESVNDYLRQRKWGFSAAAWYSMLVRNEQISRDKALELTLKEEEQNLREPHELELWLEMLNLSREDLKGFEKRSQSHYIPTQDRIRNATDRVLGDMVSHLPHRARARFTLRRYRLNSLSK
ncbi:MAG: N-acetyl sugar amidotransferase [Candidatus Bathyarchaeia archaeon]|jgi:N-acetyl sugar amidotransferase